MCALHKDTNDVVEEEVVVEAAHLLYFGENVHEEHLVTRPVVL